MKTVSGQVLSAKTISVPKAAKSLSNFVAAETGASRAVSAYLRRASAEFIGLVQFHKDLKASKYDRELKKHSQESTDNEDPMKYERNPEESKVGWRVEDIVGSGNGRRNRHKKKQENEVEAVGSTEQSKSKKKKMKRRKIEGQY